MTRRYDGIECPEEKLEFECVVESTIETFLPAAFKTRLARFLMLAEEDIEVTAEAASLVVRATISAGSAGTHSLRDLTSQLQTLSSDTASDVLGMRVLSIAPIKTTSDAAATNAGAMQAVRAEVSARARRTTAVIAITIAMVVAAIAIVAVLICCGHTKRRSRASRPATSSTGAPPLTFPLPSSTSQQQLALAHASSRSPSLRDLLGSRLSSRGLARSETTCPDMGWQMPSPRDDLDRDRVLSPSPVCSAICNLEICVQPDRPAERGSVRLAACVRWLFRLDPELRWLCTSFACCNRGCCYIYSTSRFNTIYT